MVERDCNTSENVRSPPCHTKKSPAIRKSHWQRTPCYRRSITNAPVPVATSSRSTPVVNDERDFTLRNLAGEDNRCDLWKWGDP